MSYIEKKWQTNTEKVAFAQSFPGRVTQWESLLGKRLKGVVPFQAQSEGVVLVFDDGAFFTASSVPDTPQTTMAALEAARELLEPFHAEAYGKLSELTEHDREMSRLARMERIVDAVRNNMGQMPELEAALRELLGPEA